MYKKKVRNGINYYAIPSDKLAEYQTVTSHLFFVEDGTPYYYCPIYDSLVNSQQFFDETISSVCLHSGRQSIGVELNENYFNLAKRRYDE